MLALAGKYLGAIGVLAIFVIAAFVIAVMGLVLRRRYPHAGPGQVQSIPPYALPRWRPLLRETWLRTGDVLTIVTPLLVGGSVVLALLGHIGADGQHLCAGCLDLLLGLVERVAAGADRNTRAFLRQSQRGGPAQPL